MPGGPVKFTTQLVAPQKVVTNFYFRRYIAAYCLPQSQYSNIHTLIQGLKDCRIVSLMSDCVLIVFRYLIMLS